MSREYRSSDIQSDYLRDRYRDVDTTLRLELAALPGIVDIVQRVCAPDSTETAQVIDTTFIQVQVLCKKMIETVKQACLLFEQTAPDITALEHYNKDQVAQIPEKIHSQLRSIGRFLSSDVMQDAMLGLIDIKVNVEQYAPITEVAATLYDQLAELELIIDGYILEYPQSTI